MRFQSGDDGVGDQASAQLRFLGRADARRLSIALAASAQESALYAGPQNDKPRGTRFPE